MGTGTVTATLTFDTSSIETSLANVREALAAIGHAGETAMTTENENIQTTITWDVTLATTFNDNDYDEDSHDIDVHLGMFNTVDTYDVTLRDVSEAYPNYFDDEVEQIFGGFNVEPDDVSEDWDDSLPERYNWYNYSDFTDPLTGRYTRFRHDVNVVRVSVEERMLHDVSGRKRECQCEACRKPDDQRALEKITNTAAYAMVSKQTPERPFVARYDDGYAIDLVGSTNHYSATPMIAIMDTPGSGWPVSVSIVRGDTEVYINDTWRDARELPAIETTNDNGEAVTFTFSQVADALATSFKELGYGTVVGENDDRITLANGDFRLYKVTDSEGRAKSGGSHDYSLPVSTHDWRTTWTPGDWAPTIEEVSMCEIGYHVTTDPLSWWEYGARIFETEQKGVDPVRNEDKFVAQSIRLTKEVPLRSVLPGVGWMLEFFDEVVVPAMASFGRIVSGEEPRGEMPVWATVEDGSSSRPTMPLGAAFKAPEPRQSSDPRDKAGTMRMRLLSALDSLTPDGLSWDTRENLRDLLSSTINTSYASSYIDKSKAETLVWTTCVAKGYIPEAAEAPFGRLIVEAYGSESLSEAEEPEPALA